MELHNKIVIMVLASLVYQANNFASPYYMSPINRKENQIKTKFIDQSSATVAAKNNPTLSEEFKSFLGNDKIMQKIQKINLEGSSGATLEVTTLEEDIIESLQDKEEILKILHGRCLPKQVGFGLLAGTGLLSAAVGANKRSDHEIKAALMLVGGAAVVSGAIGLYLLSGEKGRLEKHIAQVQVMNKDWQEFFVVSEQK